jgi:hypothetical protein
MASRPAGRRATGSRVGKVEYRVTPDGLLLVTQGSDVLVEERGEWQAEAAQRTASPATLAQSVGVRLQSGYATARASLLGAAWKADAAWGLAGVHQALTYRQYPEILCGEGYDAVCTGRFQKADRAILVMVDPRSKTLRVTSVDAD